METTGPPPLDVVGSLENQRIFITGATGFIGKALVEKLLWSVPEVGKLLLLVRPGTDRDAEARVRRELLQSPAMARLRALHGGDWETWAAAKIEVVAGDLGADRFGLGREAWSALAARIDRVVAAAASVRFDERLDVALETNTLGAQRTLELARAAGNAPLLQVSTCFVGGQSGGTAPERIAEIDSLTGARLGAALDALEAATRSATAAGAAPERWRALGAEMARDHGFHDVYTLTKSLAERVLDRDRGDVPVAIVRPSIVEGAAAEPIPGWLESIRVADPVLAAYGRGRTRRIPGDPDAPLDLVPVDYVVNCALAALGSLDSSPGLRIYQVCSSRNPIRLGELLDYARKGFGVTPLRDEHGEPFKLREPRFTKPARLRRAVARRLRRVNGALGALRKLPTPASWIGRLGARQRTLEHFLHLIEVYRPYLTESARFEDRSTRELWDRLTPEQRERFPFDVMGLDWPSYISEVHVPGLIRFPLRSESGAPPPEGPEAPRSERRALAETRAREAENLFELFASAAREAPDRVAFQTCRAGRWLRYTYDQALVTTANLAQTLAERYGVGHGDRVVLWAGGSPEWVLTLFALHRLGAVAVPLDPQWPADEVEAAAEHLGAKLICGAPSLARKLEGLERPVVVLREPFVPAPDVGRLPGTRTQLDAVGPQDQACIFFTSGTTVEPKAVPLTHGNLLANVRDLVPLMDLSRDRLLSVLPIHHVFELTVGLLAPLAGCSTISYVAEVKPAEISWMMGVTRPTVLVAVPRLLELLHGGIMRSVAAGGPLLGGLFKMLFALSRLTRARYGHRLFGKVHRRFGGSLRRIVTGGSALAPELGESFRLMGFEVAEGYGMTETSPVLTVNAWGETRFGTVGKPLPGVCVQTRPARGRNLDNGTGEIWVRGASVMAGYLDNPEATAAVMKGGWLNTGDLGHFDRQGYLHISGRTKEVIVTAAGKNVYPEEVESRYRDLPGVEELVVLGLPDPVRGGGSEVVGAVIVPSADATQAEVEAALAARAGEIPSYQQIVRVEIWRGELPKTTTLKVKRGRLRERVLSATTAASPGGSSAGAVAPKAAEPAAALTADEAWVVSALARLTRTRRDLLDPSVRLADLGVDSLTRVELIGEIEARFGLALDDARVAALVRVRDLFELLPAVTPEPAVALGHERGEIRP